MKTEVREQKKQKMQNFLEPAKSWFYYLRDGNKQPRVTVCLMKTNGVITRGVSLCSHLDVLKKNKGKSKAAGRAIKALLKKENALPINRPEAIRVLASVGGAMQFQYKSEFSPTLMSFEEKMIQA